MEVLAISALFSFFLNCQGASNTHYRAAVVEFAPVVGNVSANTERFISFIQDASQKGVDIIVFPETAWNGQFAESYTDDMLTGVPHPKANVVPCNSPDEFNFISKALKQLSCAVKEHGIYVVVNVREVEFCLSCVKGTKQYNTNVVLDRNGMLIARYRKYHLYNETGTSTTAEPAIFDTDFGVRFGTFICFDLWYDKPALQMIKQLGITDIVFSTDWRADLPFLTGVQIQEMWAYAQDVNLIAAGLNNPLTASSGSGIYAGKQGAIVRTFPIETTTEMLIADVPIKKLGSLAKPVPVQPGMPIPSSSSASLIQMDLSPYESVALEDISNQTTVCYNEFCCKFSVTYKPPTKEVGYRYRAVAFNGVSSFHGFGTGGVQVCAIVICSNDSVTSCGVRKTPEHTFEQIYITGTFLEKRAIHMPSTLIEGEQLQPLDVSQYSCTSSCVDGLCDVGMSLEEKVDNLATFGIYGRNFAADGQPASLAPARHFQFSMETANQLRIWISALFADMAAWTYS